MKWATKCANYADVIEIQNKLTTSAKSERIASRTEKLTCSDQLLHKLFQTQPILLRTPLAKQLFCELCRG